MAQMIGSNRQTKVVPCDGDRMPRSLHTRTRPQPPTSTHAQRKVIPSHDSLEDPAGGERHPHALLRRGEHAPACGCRGVCRRRVVGGQGDLGPVDREAERDGQRSLAQVVALVVRDLWLMQREPVSGTLASRKVDASTHPAALPSTNPPMSNVSPQPDKTSAPHPCTQAHMPSHAP